MTITPETLLRAFARTRSEAAFRSLYDVTTPGMLGFALRLTGDDRPTAEDLVQDAWLRAVDRVERFMPSASVGRWLNGFVLNCWRERRRRWAREDSVGPEELDRLVVDAAPLWSEAPLLRRAVAAMPDGYRAVLVLHDIEGYTHAEIAEQMGIEEGTSKSQLARARRCLRQLLGARTDDPQRAARSTDAD